MLLVASIVSLYVTGESIIKARKRWLRKELDGTELMTDRNKDLERNRVVLNVRSSRSTPNSSAHGGSAWLNGTPSTTAVIGGLSTAFGNQDGNQDKPLNA